MFAVGFIGQSGTGKTTLMEKVVGAASPLLKARITTPTLTSRAKTAGAFARPVRTK